MDPQQAYDKSVEAAERGEWDTAIHFAQNVPVSWDIYQQFPSIAENSGEGMPDEAVHKVLDLLEKNPRLKEHSLPSFLFEYSSNIPKQAKPETLERVAHLGKEDAYVTENINSHPNWKPSEATKGLQNAGSFWNNFERKVAPHHFATIKSLYTNKPETVTDHRKETGSSHEHMHLLPHLKEYATKAQQEVMNDAREFPWSQNEEDIRQSQSPFTRGAPRLRIKYFKGEPHIKVYRGIGGDYAEDIARKAGLDEFGTVDKKLLKIPTAHLTSWSADPDFATMFGGNRAKDLHETGQPHRALMIEKWMPVKSILHSGFHKMVTNQDHAHSHEYELVMGHPEEHVKVPTSGIHVIENHPTHDISVSKPVKVRAPIKKSESVVGTEAEIAKEMMGHNEKFKIVLDAAKFLANKKDYPDADKVAEALQDADDDIEEAALRAFGLDVTEQNLKALNSICNIQHLNKHEDEYIEIGNVEAFNPDAQQFKEAIERACERGIIVPIKLGGKHSEGILIALDPQMQQSYLLKPGSGSLSPAKGVREENASQSRREVAFWHVATDWGLGEYLPRTELLLIDGKEYACMRLLTWDYKSLDKLNRQYKDFAKKVLKPYEENGTLHKWAMLDAILANSDRHGNNVMCCDKDIKLIDHGSAFAGQNFSPATDKKTFVPFYLRFKCPKGFRRLDTIEKLEIMPRIDKATEKQLRDWVEYISIDKLKRTLEEYGINPDPSVQRFYKLKMQAADQEWDLTINRFWVGY